MQNIRLLGARPEIDGLEIDSRQGREAIIRQTKQQDDQPEYLDEIQFEKTLQPSEAMEINENLSCLLRLGACGELSIMATLREQSGNHFDMDQEEEEQQNAKGFFQKIEMLTDPDKPYAQCPMFVCSDEQPMQTVQIPEAAQQTQTTPTKSSNTSMSTELGGAAFVDETRKDKLRRYMQKRSRRNWNRKVYYDCRKKVADSRLRIKGRFITRDKAQILLGESIQGYSLQELKCKLQKHMEDNRKASAELTLTEPKNAVRKKMLSVQLDNEKMQEQEPVGIKNQECS